MPSLQSSIAMFRLKTNPPSKPAVASYLKFRGAPGTSYCYRGYLCGQRFDRIYTFLKTKILPAAPRETRRVFDKYVVVNGANRPRPVGNVILGPRSPRKLRSWTLKESKPTKAVVSSCTSHRPVIETHQRPRGPSAKIAALDVAREDAASTITRKV
jgi:hypothetical protein